MKVIRARMVVIYTFLLISPILCQNFSSFTNCLTKRRFISNDIVQRGNSKAYSNLNYQFRINPPQIRPLAYVLPSRERDVVSAVSCGKRNNISVTARCGGHQYEKYAYGDENSVVIDLQKMNAVSLLGKRATVGGGAILGPMAWKLWTLGQRFFPIGLCPMVGIGGLAPGGGHGYFTRRFGLTTDFIEEMNVVTAAGKVLTVNNVSNSDLYWALRGGGGGSFGIITRFIFRTVPTPQQIFEGILYYNLDDFPDVFQAWQRFHAGAPRRITPNFRLRNRAIEMHFFDSTGTNNTFQRLEQRFPKPRNRTTTMYNYPDFLFYMATNFGGSLKPGIILNRPSDLQNLKHGSSKPEHIKTRSFFVPRLLSKNETYQFYDFLKDQPPAVRCRFEGYGGAVNDVGQSDTAFVHRNQNGYNARATVDYTLVKTVSENKTAIRWVNRFFKFGAQIFGSRETYQNYPDMGLKNYLRRYYGGNLQRLIRVKRKYDPDNYFRNPQSIPPSRFPEELKKPYNKNLKKN